MKCDLCDQEVVGRTIKSPFRINRGGVTIDDGRICVDCVERMMESCFDALKACKQSDGKTKVEFKAFKNDLGRRIAEGKNALRRFRAASV